MTLFRPCIDLHQGQVKQIIGGSLTDTGANTNFISQHDSAYYANLYRESGLKGGHIISLGAGNEEEVKKALTAYPGGLQFGGGVNPDNAKLYLDLGASHIIVTSFIFSGATLCLDKLKAMKKTVGKKHLVLDLSCRRSESGWLIATNRWQTVTHTAINAQTLAQLADYCDEFLVHAADVEGLQQGMDTALVETLGTLTEQPITYAGGARNLTDLKQVQTCSQGKVDVTIGSALDIFGGKGITLQECIAFNAGKNTLPSRPIN